MTDSLDGLPTRGSSSRSRPRTNPDASWSTIDADQSSAPPATALSGSQIALRLLLSLGLIAGTIGLVLAVSGNSPTLPGLAAGAESAPAASGDREPSEQAVAAPDPTATTALVLGETVTPIPTLRVTSTPLPAVATPTPPPASQRVEAVIAQLRDDADRWTDGANISMAVVVDGLILGINPEQTQNTASEMKAVWITAAAETAGLPSVEELAPEIFTRSSNRAAAEVINLVEIDGVNRWTEELGMTDTYLSAWRNPDESEPDLQASDRGARGLINQSSALDQVTFLVALERGDLVTADDTASVLSWMQLAPDTSTGDDPSAVFVNALPADIAEQVSHKAGWLPPGCCSREARVLNAIGFVPLPSGQQVPVAIMTELGGDYPGQAAFISSAVCQLYEVLAPTSLECPRPPE